MKASRPCRNCKVSRSRCKQRVRVVGPYSRQKLGKWKKLPQCCNKCYHPKKYKSDKPLRKPLSEIELIQ